jgi:hypothetical protein
MCDALAICRMTYGDSDHRQAPAQMQVATDDSERKSAHTYGGRVADDARAATARA